MKQLFIIAYLSLSLHAGYFNNAEETNKQGKMIKTFRQIVSNGNSLIKKGDFEKYTIYHSDINSLFNTLKSVDLTKSEKISLKNNLKKYTYIIDLVYIDMKEKTPNLNAKYITSLHGLLNFDKEVESTGYRPLINEWYNLAKIKHKFIKKPSYKLSQEFDKKWHSVMFILTDLCLDDEYEDPMIAYLDVYKSYFNDLNSVYKSIKYSNITSIKPLSYTIKSKLEFTSIR